MRGMTLARVKRRLAQLASNINSLTKREIKGGRAISFGTLTPPSPNTTKGRTPTPFSGGN
jgi:hypothetical protein